MRFGMIVFLLTLSVYIFLVPDRTSAKLTSPAPRQLKVGKATPEVQQLRDAYHILEVANHDYKGHRKAAMREIDRACKLMGVEPRGDGAGKEPQGTSDSQLRAAQSMLQSARTIASSEHLAQVVGHIDGAIREISVALHVK